jgi:sugar lactone lactonase YvrE
MRSQTAHLLLTPPTEAWRYLPEGPRRVTVAGRDHIAWVNIQNGGDAKTGMIFARPMHGGGDDRRVACPGRPGFILPVDGGDRVLVGLDKELRVCNIATGEWSEPLARLPDDNPHTMCNDGEIVPGGKAIVFGTKDTARKAGAHLYLYTVDDRKLSVLADKQTISNGKVMFADDRGLVLLDIDTPTHKVVRYRLDVARRTATPDGVVLDLTRVPASPDGMRNCGDGTAVIAFFNGHAVGDGRAVRYDLSTGEELEEWVVPGSPRVTCPCVQGGQIIFTTAVEGMSPEMRASCPNAGCLFIGEIGASSSPAGEFVKL